jgi:hypothetical protein
MMVSMRVSAMRRGCASRVTACARTNRANRECRYAGTRRNVATSTSR